MISDKQIVTQLHQDKKDLEQRLHRINLAIEAFDSIGTGRPGRKRRKMSAAARAKIAKAQRQRWAKVRAGKGRD